MKKKLSIFNFQFSHFEKGYTLIELLAVMIILVTVGTILAGIIVSSLRGSNRSKNVGDVRQAGNSALVQVSKIIKFAKSFDGISTNGINYVTNCILPQITPTPLPTEYKFLKLTAFDETQTVASCSGNSIYVNTSELIDSTSFLIPQDKCFFTCAQNNIAIPPTISINFTVSTLNSTSAFVENRVSLDFKTSAAFRNN